MAAKSIYLDDAILDHVLRNTALSSPTTVFVALYTVAPTPSTTGTEVTTVGTAYVRQAVTFGAPSSGVCQNSAPVAFPVATAPYGAPIVACAVCDLVAGGNILYFGTLGTPKTVGTGDQVNFAALALSVTEQ
jgi:hypothetical protein